MNSNSSLPFMNENRQNLTQEDEKMAFQGAGSAYSPAGTNHDNPRHRHHPSHRTSSDFSAQEDNARKGTLSEIDKTSPWSNSLNRSMIPRSSKQNIANIILQISAIVAAIAFGVFAVQSAHLANQANHYAAAAANLSLASNQMAMYAICISSQLQVCCTGS